MQNFTKLLAASVVAISLGLFGTTQVLAKAHDQGVADGDRSPGTSQAGGAGVGGQGGISGGVNGGQRGSGASAAGSDNSGDKGLGRGGADPDNGQ